MIDRYVNCQGRKLSREAPVPVADYISEELVLGGAGNLPNNLLALGANVKAFGAAGKDEAGKWLRDQLEKKGADLPGLVVSEPPTSPKTRTSLYPRQYHRSQNQNQ